MRRFRFLPLAALAPVALAVTMASQSGATIIERVVAVVGDQAILLSEVRARARPYLRRLDQQGSGGAQRAAATSQIFRSVLDRMVEEELERLAASRAKVTVSVQEVDDALARVATQNRMTVDKLLAEATRTGLDEQEYRQEIRRQLLEAKLLNLRVQGRLRIGDDDLRTTYRKIVLEEREKLPFSAAWIVFRTTKGDRGSERRLADSIARTARAGADFADLARTHSADVGTRARGGELGRLDPGQLPRPVDQAIRTLEVGEVSEPIRMGDDIVIVKMLGRDASQLPAFADARDELRERVYVEKMDKARRQWLDGLRRQNHVDVRL